MAPDSTSIAERFKSIQDAICAALEKQDGAGTFVEDLWERPEGGGGRTRILQHGTVIEKGGVNFSAVHGQMPEFLSKEIGKEATQFFATGVSIVIHPNSPKVPIIHMNIRYFETDSGVWWFGGGIDLTPHYVVEDQASWFHRQLKEVCDAHQVADYAAYKDWADNYFYIPHRNETRGVGGIFFDKLDASKGSKEDIFNYVVAVGEAFAPIYTKLMEQNSALSYTDEHKQWQQVRRGRYVEFNLVYDRGTQFGLKTNGRIESILMSLPESAGWFYNLKPEANSPEAKTLALLTKGIDWAGK